MINKHINKICKKAGLEVMIPVLNIIRDRDGVNDNDLLKLTSEDVARLYDNHVGPTLVNIECEIIG